MSTTNLVVDGPWVSLSWNHGNKSESQNVLGLHSFESVRFPIFWDETWNSSLHEGRITWSLIPY